MQYNYPITVSQCHNVTVTQYHSITVSQYHNVTMSQCLIVTVSHCHSVIVSQYQYVAVLEYGIDTLSQCNEQKMQLTIVMQRFLRSKREKVCLSSFLNTCCCPGHSILLLLHWCNPVTSLTYKSLSHNSFYSYT